MQRCLDSIYRNTYRSLEIICVNDGSTDGSLDILRSQTDNRIIVIDQQNRGVSAARNAGMKVAKGEYVAFIDPDDWVHCRYFEFLVKAISMSDVACCLYNRVCSWVEDKPEEYSSVHALTDVLKNLTNTIGVQVWGKLYRRMALGKVKFCEEIAAAEDKLFNLEVMAKTIKVSFIENKLYYYYNRVNSLVHTHTNMPFTAALKVFELSQTTNNPEVIVQSYRMLLACRYLNMFDSNYIGLKQEINEMLRKLEKISRPHLKFQDRVMYGVLTRFSMLYRLWRIAGDRTLLEWEANQKNKQKSKISK